MMKSTSVAEVTNATMAAKPTEATPLRRPDGGVTTFAKALHKEYAAVLARPGGRPSRLACLDGARFLAFLWVVSYHSTMGFKSWTAEATGLRMLACVGWLGVPVFLGLSGFLISRSLARVVPEGKGMRPEALGRWAAGRFLRIWPALAGGAALSMMLVGFLVEAHPGLNKCWWTYISLDLNLRPLASTVCPESVFWSVSLECQFYLLCPLFALVRARSRGAFALVALGVFASSLMLRIVEARRIVLETPEVSVPRHVFMHTGSLSEAMYYRPWYRASEFAAGVLGNHASVLLDEGGSRRLRRGAELIAFGGLMAFAVCLYLFAAAKESGSAAHTGLDNPHWAAHHPSAAIFAASCLPAAVALTTAFGAASAGGGAPEAAAAPVRWARSVLEHPCLYAPAALAYTAYLMSAVPISLAFFETPGQVEWLQSWWGYNHSFEARLGANVAVSMVLGLFLTVLVERPAMALAHVLLRKPAKGEVACLPAKAVPFIC